MAKKKRKTGTRDRAAQKFKSLAKKFRFVTFPALLKIPPEPRGKMTPDRALKYAKAHEHAVSENKKRVLEAARAEGMLRREYGVNPGIFGGFHPAASAAKKAPKKRKKSRPKATSHAAKLKEMGLHEL